jgi:hypothetical protein
MERDWFLGVQQAPEAVSGPGCTQMMPFSYGAERKVLQMQTDARPDGFFEVTF